MRSLSLIVLALAAAGCSFDTSVPLGPGGYSPPDAAESTIDAGEQLDIDASSAAKKHLLLSEIQPKGEGFEYIEIHNPTTATVALDNYYVSDSQEYALLPGRFGAGPGPDIAVADFIVRFPEGAGIEAGETQVIAIRPSFFFSDIFGVAPDYRIEGEQVSAQMLRAYQGSIGNFPTITDNGEGISLFIWSGETDLVTDVDLVEVGPDISATNALANKTGLSVDGPDPARDETTYRVDLATMTEVSQELEFAESYHRILPEEGHERHDVTGNGKFLHDETTEDIATTWGVSDVSPGTLPAGL